MKTKTSTIPVVVYTPESPLKHPFRLFALMLRDLGVSRTLAWRLIVRDISAQYRQTVLGYLWAVLPTLITTVLWIFLNASQIVVVDSGDVPYPIFALTGITFWQLFVDSLNAPLSQLNANRSMLTKINFPKEALVLSGIAQVLFSFSIKLIILALMLIVFQIPIKWTALLILFPLFGLLMLGTLAGILLVPMGILYRDIQQGISIFITPLMFITPVVYPAPAYGVLALLMQYNPLTPFFQLLRDLLYIGVPQSWGETLVVMCVGGGLLFLGWVSYRLALPILVERLDA